MNRRIEEESTGLKKTAFNQTTVYFLLKIIVLDDKLKLKKMENMKVKYAKGEHILKIASLD